MIVSPSKTTPFASSSARAASTSATRSAIPAGEGANGWPMLDGSKTSSVTWPQRSSMSRVALGLDLEPERLDVELLRPLEVLRQDRHEIDVLDLHRYGVVPSAYGA